MGDELGLGPSSRLTGCGFHVAYVRKYDFHLGVALFLMTSSNRTDRQKFKLAASCTRQSPIVHAIA